MPSMMHKPKMPCNICANHVNTACDRLTRTCLHVQIKTLDCLESHSLKTASRREQQCLSRNLAETRRPRRLLKMRIWKVPPTSEGDLGFCFVHNTNYTMCQSCRLVCRVPAVRLWANENTAARHGLACAWIWQNSRMILCSSYLFIISSPDLWQVSFQRFPLFF